MNSGALNGLTINGSAAAQWVVRAVVVATASASLVSLSPLRTAHGTAFGEATVTATLSADQLIALRAVGTCGATSFCSPGIIYAGATNVTATATGNAAVRRDVYSSAAGDAVATGTAFAVDALGESSATAMASVDLCKAHIVHPGAVASLVGGTGSGAGDVTRYPVVDTTLATVWRTRAEASQKLAGETTYSHDGYVPVGYADATAQATVHQDRLTTIATLGAFAFCDATGSASGFVRYRASVAAVGASTGMQAGASLTKSGSVASAAGASGSSTGVRSVLPQATHASGCDAYPLIGLVRHAGAVSVSCDAIALPVVGKRTAYVTASATAGGELSAFIVTGNQYKAFASGLCESSVSVSPPKQTHAGSLFADALATSGQAKPGYQNFAYVLSSAGAIATSPMPEQLHAGGVVGQANAISYPTWYATQHYSLVTAQIANALGVECLPHINYVAQASGSGGCTYPAITALLNSDAMAPDERYMNVAADDRVMFVAEENRLMVIA